MVQIERSEPPAAASANTRKHSLTMISSRSVDEIVSRCRPRSSPRRHVQHRARAGLDAVVDGEPVEVVAVRQCEADVKGQRMRRAVGCGLGRRSWRCWWRDEPEAAEPLQMRGPSPAVTSPAKRSVPAAKLGDAGRIRRRLLPFQERECCPPSRWLPAAAVLLAMSADTHIIVFVRATA